MPDLARVFKALSDETRLDILGLVFRHGPLCVCEVERVLGITQSKASRHLRYLRDGGVLIDVRAGPIVNYSLPDQPDPRIERILELLESLLASRPLPEAGPALVQIRLERSEGVTIDEHERRTAGGPAGGRTSHALVEDAS